MTHQVEISHPDKVLYPAIGLTKQDVVDLYKDLAPFLFPHIKGRPLVVQRFPDGIEGEGFYQQQVPDYYPDWVSVVEVERKSGKKERMLEVHTQTELSYVVNQGGFCFHMWHSREESLNRSDLLIFDLDPSNEKLQSTVPIAQDLKQLIEELGGTPYVMTTGSHGLHVVIPIYPEKEENEVKEYAKKIAEAVVERNPKQATLAKRKKDREGKVFVDYLRNSFGQTSIAPYSLRAKENAPVATPLEWEELKESSLDAQKYHAKNIMKRLSQKEDPWKGMSRHRVSVEGLRI